MSGFVGRIALGSAPVDAQIFRGAEATLAHHGPEAGRLVDGPVALAMAGRHMASGRPANRAGERLGSFAIVADAVLDNRGDLAEALGLGGKGSARFSDGALILRAYAAWGAACLPRLLGDFAFAITHLQSGETFLARDHIGARPLYTARSPSTLSFSSDISALLALGEADIAIDEAIVARYLARPDEPLNATFFRGIDPLPPGRAALHITGGEQRHVWWDPAKVPPRSYPESGALAEDLRAAVSEAVRASAEVDAPLGAHLSGGVDSTAVAALAAPHGLGATYSWSPEISPEHPHAAGRDERDLIAALSADIGAPHRYGLATAAAFQSFLADPVELTGIADLVDEAPVQTRAAEDGIGVMLSGWGGDEAFSAHGIGYAAYQLRRGRLGAALTTARHRAGGLRRTRALSRALWQDGIVPLLPGGLYDRLTPFQNPFQNNSFAAPSLRSPQLDGAAKAKLRPRIGPDPTGFLAALIGRGHLAMRMEHWALSGARHGLTYRYPLTARPVIEAILGAAPELAFGDGTPRALCRAAFPELGLDRCRKTDPANEALRAEIKRGCWALLARDADEGRFDGSCDWIDAAALRRAVMAVPQQMSPPHALIFAEITAAIRVWELFQRQSVPGNRPIPN